MVDRAAAKKDAGLRIAVHGVLSTRRGGVKK